ncbi:MAG: CDP-glucose 4,6-dehydratase [Pseudomonadota bacterium]
MFSGAFEDKTVVVTGNTGFKGAWLTMWLQKLGARVVGVSVDVPTEPAMFRVLGIEDRIEHHYADVRNLDEVRKIISNAQPDFVFHLAAQAIVSQSYADPLSTISTNALGTANILEALRSVDKKCTAVLITSDKCYENVEWEWGYRETDHLGGKDVYSASKAAAEVIIRCYVQSFFQGDGNNVSIVSARAGNVIGGGDWAKDRIVVDCMTSWAEGRTVQLRSPRATRPWQHVLEPLSGYLALAARVATDSSLHGESFNFGPRAEQNFTVLELLQDLRSHWTGDSDGKGYEVVDDIPFKEAGLLKLNCDKAMHYLKWAPTLSYEQCVEFVGSWYSEYYSNNASMFDLTNHQLTSYEQHAANRGLAWAKS